MIKHNKHEKELKDFFFSMYGSVIGPMRGSREDNAEESGLSAKFGQIMPYLEIIDSRIRRLSKKRPAVLVENCAGNCYLSFMLSRYYSMTERPVEIFCVDRNERLMDKASERAAMFGISNMRFYGCDVLDFVSPRRPDAVLSLHACDSATDKSIFQALRINARNIFSVSCCQHSARRSYRNGRYRGITRHDVFKERMVHMVSDSLRALLLEKRGYSVSLFEFVSSRYTGKNTMLRAEYNPNAISGVFDGEYERIRDEFRIRVPLEDYLEYSAETAV